MLQQIELHIRDSRWRKIRGLRATLKKACYQTLTHLPASLVFPITVNLLLTNDKAVRKLNRDFRGMDKPTNVLSFPQYESSQLTKMGRGGEHVEIGDIVMGYQYIVAEAKKDHKILINHITHLFIHGLLHLFGYDHMTNKEADRMERLEKKIMAKLNLPDPYIVQVAELKPVQAKAKVGKKSVTKKHI